MSGISSCRPERLRRHRDTTAAMADGLDTRAGHLDTALATYRARCDWDYRVPTLDTDQVVRDWARAVRDLGQWTGAVGDAFIRADVLARFTGSGPDIPSSLDELAVRGQVYATSGDTDAVWTMPTGLVADHLDGGFEDDPFLGVPEGGFTVDDVGGDASPDADSTEALLELLGDLGMTASLADNASAQLIQRLSEQAVVTTITVRVTSTHVLLLDDGRLIQRMTRTEATARLVAPRGVPGGLTRFARWSKGLGGTINFATGAISQWQQDAGLPIEERLVRAGTKGIGVLGGALAGGAAGGTAGALCGPGAPVCSTVLGFAGGLLGGIGGAIGGGWLVDLLPWMDPPPDPTIGEYDLGSLEDEIAQSDGRVSGDLAHVDAMTTIIASDLASAETASDPDVHAQLDGILPDRDDLLVDAGLADPAPSAPPTGTTTTTVPGD